MDQTIVGIFKNKIRKILLSSVLALGILIDLAIMSCEVLDGYSSVWDALLSGLANPDAAVLVCVAVLALLMVGIAVSVAGIFASLVHSQVVLYPFAVGLCSHVLMLILSSVFDIYSFIGGLWMVLQILLSLIGLIYAILCILIGGAKKKRSKSVLNHTQRRLIMLAIGTLSQLVPLLLFFIPFFTYTVEEYQYRVIPIGIFTDELNVMLNLMVFVALFVFCSVSFISYLGSFKQYSSSESEYADKIQGIIILNTVITGLYYVAGMIWVAFRNSKGGDYTTESYFPFVLMVILATAFAFVIRGIQYDPIGRQEKIATGARIEFFIYSLIMSGITAAACCSDILRVTIVKPEGAEAIRLNGWKILTSMNSVEAGFQMGAFFIIAMLAITVALVLATSMALISRSKLFYKLALYQMIAGAMSTMIVGLFGKYYEIVQKMNQEALEAWIGRFLPVGEFEILYKIKSQAFWWFVGAMAVVVIAVIRKPYTRGMMAESLLPSINSKQGNSDGTLQPVTDPTAGTKEPVNRGTVDPCPAFTELDAKIPQFEKEQELISRHAYPSPTLPDLVQFVVNYARDSRLHLYYTPQDIAAFIAGLGASRLTILQGMSGTGKTSLPKIFTEAVLGNCELIEVESSWRDKNELLGYYNEFSRIYTPKKFTQALYKAKLNPERLTFIVLDEMNLSRVEYYFSDFLSLMEHEEDKREIKLLNIGLYRTEGGNRYPYQALSDGHTIKIPSNVWFVGTANRDESTFEISDKVYDRAHTMNFNQRASKMLHQHTPIPQRYLSVDDLLQLFEEAQRTIHFDLDSSTVVKEVEELLAPYNISFGNRVANQMEVFVSIYAACFAPSEAIMHEALETILLSKVVSKLEFRSVDDKEQLATEFERLNLLRCAEFVRRLHED